MALWEVIIIGLGAAALFYFFGCIAAYYFHRWVGLRTTTLYDYLLMKNGEPTEGTREEAVVSAAGLGGERVTNNETRKVVAFASGHPRAQWLSILLAAVVSFLLPKS